MGWTPDQVRAHSLSDIAAAFEGWQMSRGIEPPLKQTVVAEIDSLMAKYPDKVH